MKNLFTTSPRSRSAAVLVAVVASLALSSCSVWQSEDPSDPLTANPGDCNGRLAVDHEYTVWSSNKDERGAERDVRCEPDVADTPRDTGPQGDITPDKDY